MRNVTNHYQSRPSVLVIDDDDAVALAIAARLGQGFRVVGLADPQDAVKAAREEKPGVILCDIDMPGMRGDDVAYALSQDASTAGIPLIYLTSLVSPDEPPDLEGVFGDYPTISKGASTAALLDLVTRAVFRTPDGDEPDEPLRPL
jgi:CheY-like chemotaxis protein